MVLAGSWSLLTENCTELKWFTPVMINIYDHPSKKDEFNIQFCQLDINLNLKKRRRYAFKGRMKPKSLNRISVSGSLWPQGP
ncbi:Putative protein [Zobellia galactanivorans]|uniref:Uncharacterized protein n=1 Tax=Zobellia galactanivorans (strain DSM 12802 / CCUG 47099 / CIP 106680 / NCIMB 13871 / Dsij) TaxID=63186 RepID=G0LAY8_ZOBGA|nr:Putative protein [Zobellia galactanivorans]